MVAQVAWLRDDEYLTARIMDRAMRVGTVSFIEPTRPEYKILAVHFRDEITRPLLQPWRACLAIRRRLGRAWVVIHDFGGQEGEDLVARKQEKGD